MKKLALALVCFASVAFIASCTPEITNPEPSIALKTGENYVYDGQTIDIDTEYMLGFRAASNSQTLKELSTFKLGIRILELDGTEVDNADTLMNISGTEFVYDHVLNFTLSRELVGKAEITATVTDVDGKLCTTTINLNVNQPAQQLISRAITWVRKGTNVEDATATELANIGLQWTGSYRDIMATIRPLDNADVTLYLCPGDDFAKITTDVEKASYFASLPEYSDASVIDKYRNISAEVSHTYNDMLAVVYNGGNYLVHITQANVEAITSGGQYIRTDITITGETK